MFNLASSFRLRNKLKEKISSITDTIENAEFSESAGTEENTNPCDGKTLEEAIAEVHTLMNFLQELNEKIEKANSINKASLIMLETIKSKIAFYGKIVQKCRQCKKYNLEYNEEGERIKVLKEALVDQKAIIALLANLKKEKDFLEEKIAAANFNIVVDFDPEIILSRI